MNRCAVNKIQRVIRRKKLSAHLYKMEQYKHHQEVTTMLHCIAVAYYSLCIASILRIKIRSESMIIGALFHDYYLYDWHVPEKYHQFHGIKHSRFAIKNLRKIYKTNAIEENIILSHMFPLTLSPPLYRESIIVSMADKWCSIQETLFSKNHQDLIQTFNLPLLQEYRYCVHNRKETP